MCPWERGAGDGCAWGEGEGEREGEGEGEGDAHAPIGLSHFPCACAGHPQARRKMMLMCEEGKGRDARALGRKGGIFLGRRSRYRKGRASLSRDRTHGRAHRSIAPASHQPAAMEAPRPGTGNAAAAPSGRAEPRFWRPRRAQRSCVLPQHTRHLDWVVTSQRRASGSGLRDGGKGRRAHWGEGRVVRLVTYGQQKTISSSSHTHEQRLSGRANARGNSGRGVSTRGRSGGRLGSVSRAKGGSRSPSASATRSVGAPTTT